MMEQEQIDLQLWAYIDGLCGESEKGRIDSLLATDTGWKQRYSELIAIHQSLSDLEPEHTSMRFSKNVMEAIANVKPSKPTRAYVNLTLVKAFAVFFVIVSLGAATYAFTKMNWQTNEKTLLPDFSRIFNDNFVLGTVFLNILLLMLVFDTLIRKKGRQHL